MYVLPSLFDRSCENKSRSQWFDVSCVLLYCELKMISFLRRCLGKGKYSQEDKAQPQKVWKVSHGDAWDVFQGTLWCLKLVWKPEFQTTAKNFLVLDPCLSTALLSQKGVENCSKWRILKTKDLYDICFGLYVGILCVLHSYSSMF